MIFSILALCFRFNTYDIVLYLWSSNSFRYLFTFPLIIIFLVTCYAETNRSPFDFSEGESELVSGFNTEYIGGIFSVIFIAEYGSILVLRVLGSTLFGMFSIISYLFTIIISLSFLWVRRTFPRLRYDKLMIIAWKGLLVYVISIAFLSFYYAL